MTVYKHSCDAVIVGAGPAGSSLAIRLALAGLHVKLIEQKRFPREKLCGEFISPECLGHFDELGVLHSIETGSARVERTVFYDRGGRSFTVPSAWFGPSAHAVGLSRAQMDFRLMTRARAVGVEVLEESAFHELILDDVRARGVRLKDGTVIPADLVVDATGRARILTGQVEKAEGRGRRSRAKYVAFKAHVNHAGVLDGDCEIYAYRGGYGGASRIENSLHNLCFIVSSEIAKRYSSDAEQVLRNVVQTNRRASEALSSAEVASHWQAVAIEGYGRSALTPAPGLIAVGDAAAFIDPFSGSGILLALESAKIAADVITKSLSHDRSDDVVDLIAREYARYYAAAFDRRLIVCSLIRHAAFIPFLAEGLIRVLSLSGTTTRQIARLTRPDAQART